LGSGSTFTFTLPSQAPLKDRAKDAIQAEFIES
jgi:hypothetical protein